MNDQVPSNARNIINAILCQYNESADMAGMIVQDLTEAGLLRSENEPPDEPTWPHPYGYIRSLLSEAVERAEADLMAVGHSQDGPERAAAMKDLENWKAKLQDAWIHGDLEVRRATQPPSDEVENLRFALRTIRDTCGNEDPHGGTRAADIAAAALLPALTKEESQ